MAASLDQLLAKGTAVLYEGSAGDTIDTVVEDHVEIEGKYYYRLTCKGKADPTKVHEKPQTRDSAAQSASTEIDPVQVEEMIMRAYTNKFEPLREMSVPAVMAKVFLSGGDMGGSQEKLAQLRATVLSLFPFRSNQAGIIYAPFQTTKQPTVTKGSGHLIFMNPFLSSSFPCSLYWSSVDVLVRSFAGGAIPGSISVWPIPEGSPNGNFASGHFQYGADGAYENGAMLASACLVAYLAATELVGTARVPEEVREHLAALAVTCRRSGKPEDRAVNCWKETLYHSNLLVHSPF